MTDPAVTTMLNAATSCRSFWLERRKTARSIRLSTPQLSFFLARAADLHTLSTAAYAARSSGLRRSCRMPESDRGGPTDATATGNGSLGYRRWGKFRWVAFPARLDWWQPFPATSNLRPKVRSLFCYSLYFFITGSVSLYVSLVNGWCARSDFGQPWRLPPQAAATGRPPPPVIVIFCHDII